MSKRLVIIDGKSVFYRGYYAMPSLSTQDGTPTGGVYGFAVLSLEIIKRLKPDYVCVAWDKRHTNIRSRLALYPQYKANRKPAPPDFYEQIPILYDLLHALGWPLYEADDYEADDLMGAFAKQVGPKGIESYLVTSDLDVLQLVNPHTHIYTLKKGLTNIELFNEASFREKYGIGAHQWVDVKALKGDSSDNVPGVAGVGEKTALMLIQKYETLDGVYKHLDDLKPTLRAKLERDRDMAYLSQKLVTLMVDAPVHIDLAHAKLHDGVTPEFVAILRKLEFRNLLRQVEGQLSPAELQKAEAHVEEHELPKMSKKKFEVADYKPGQPRLVAMNPEGTELWVSPDAQHYSVVPLANPPRQLMNGPAIGHDLKTVFRSLLANDAQWTGGVHHDTRIAAFILNPLERSRELGDLRGRILDMIDPEQVVSSIWEAYHDQQLQFDQAPDLKRVAVDLDFPMIPVLANIEHRGIHLDVSRLHDMSGKFAERIHEFEHKIYELAGQEFNVSSPSQLAGILFETLGLPTAGIKKGKTSYSTGAAELDKLRGLHPIVDLITTYREYTKLLNTYIEPLPRLVDAQGKLHTTFALDITATGRLSSTNPNLQNIPTRTEVGQAIRSAFVPAKGNAFVSADYSQFELRLAAVMADDKGLQESFNKGEDIHARTAAEVYDIPIDKVTKVQRRVAKVVNFGILYGMSPHGLSAATGMSFAEAKEFIAKYFELRKPVQKYMNEIAARALKDGYVSTIFGRRRPTPDMKSSNFAVREAARRAAINMPIQGTEADIMKLAMLAAEQNLAGLGQQILQIHDSILVECPKANASKVAKVLKDTMENIHKLPVHLKVDVTTGEDWGEL
jgi:DNA polymerase I